MSPPANTPVLLVATSTKWLGTARMPRSLTRAGFEVSLLAPKGTLAEHSRFVTRVGHLADNASPGQWVYAFAAMVKATSPGLVIPCDDMAFRLMQMLVLAPPQNLQATLRLQLAALVIHSLGDPAFYNASVDKLQLPAAAEAIGVRMPPSAVVSAVAEAEAFAAVHGYPVVLKRSYTSAGDGVEIAPDRAGLARAFGALSRARAIDLWGSASSGLLAQAHVAGRTKNYPVSAWKGTLLTGYASERLIAHPDPKGPSTVTRYHCSPEIRNMAVKLVRGFGITGLLALECLIDERSGLPYLIEINRRLVPGGHRGSSFGVDHAAALHAVVHGLPSPTRADLDPGEEHLGVHFPQEWLRDPESHWLREHPVDVPWDDPALIEAMLAMRHEP
jgi:predicted ATP-grasp superfamily ATP-dependent carboligase